MNITLTFSSCEHKNQRHTHIVDEQNFQLGMRRDLVFNSNSDNKLKLKFNTGSYYREAVDISGDTIDFIVKENPTDDDIDAILAKQEIVAIDEASRNGRAHIHITKEDCAEIIGNFIYELKRTRASDGKVFTLSFGTCSFTQSLFAS
jgi:hypothetical protein